MGNIILTSDDFGLSKIYNREILLALQYSLLTSVSIMVNGHLTRQEQQVLSLKLLAQEKNISLGLHLEIDANEKDIMQMCHNQWNKFTDILGLQPNYIDIHKDHLFKHYYDVIAYFCVEKQVAFRKYKETTVKLKAPDDMFIASTESLDTIEERLKVIKSNETLEMIFHLGMYDEDVVSSLNKERAEDRKKLEWAHQVINRLGHKLMSYNQLK
ncbi:MAG: ChbG/HpnK family deacetylase [Pedobacter sp.]|nr:MAG: ChbG/HpnK family deacetylase [Pedobacter sp.]